MSEATGLAQGEISPQQAPSPIESTPVQETREERTFRQSEVNDIVRYAKRDAIDTYRRQQVEQPQYAAEKYGRPVSHESAIPSDENLRKLVSEEARRQIDEVRKQAFQQSQEEASKKTVQNFWNKVLPGREKFEDFDKVVGDIDYARFPNVVQLLGDYIENSDAVLYELGKDRSKMATLEQLAVLSPRDAIVQAQRLSQSVKDNESAGRTRLPNEPLSQMRPTNNGTDGGVLSVSDYRKKYRV